MSRTLKDAPYWVRAYRYKNSSIPKDWRHRTSWNSWGSSRDEWHGSVFEWQEYWNNLPSDFWGQYTKGVHNAAVGCYAKQENTKNRHNTKKLIRSGEYDKIEKPVRNALWLSS